MANTCESIVRVYGTVEAVGLFKKDHVSVDESTVDFDRFLGDGESACGAVLTDIDHTIMDPFGNAPYEASLYLYVDSRWNEPIDWFNVIVARHADVTFDISWVQAADLFAGELIGVAGVVTKHECRSGDELTDGDYWVMGIDRDAEEDEPDFGQCGKCGQWVHFPCYTCIARQAFEVLSPKADATEEEALMQYIDHVAENEGGK